MQKNEKYHYKKELFLTKFRVTFQYQRPQWILQRVKLCQHLSVFMTLYCRWIIENEKASERKVNLRWRTTWNIEISDWSENSTEFTRVLRPEAHLKLKLHQKLKQAGGQKGNELTDEHGCRTLLAPGSVAELDLWPPSGGRSEIISFWEQFITFYGVFNIFEKCWRILNENVSLNYISLS